MAKPRCSKEEFAQRGDETYLHNIYASSHKQDEGKFAAIDIETGAFEIDTDKLVASDRLFARYPDAQIGLVKIGSRHVWRLGGHQRAAHE